MNKNCLFILFVGIIVTNIGCSHNSGGSFSQHAKPTAYYYPDSLQTNDASLASSYQQYSLDLPSSLVHPSNRGKTSPQEYDDLNSAETNNGFVNVRQQTSPDSSSYLGQPSSNTFDPDSVSNPYGKGNPYGKFKNPYSPYQSPYSSQSMNNPYATQAPKLYDSDGNYRGRLSNNPYDPESTSNPYGRYGSRYSPDSIHNPYGAGNPYRSDSPYNPYGEGLQIHAGD